MPAETAKLQMQPRSPLPELGPLLKKHRTFAAALKAYLEPYYGQIPAIAQGPTPEVNRARFERIFRPWPKWVFRLGAELWHVDYPTIDREVFFHSFRVMNVCVFRCSPNPEAQAVNLLKGNVFDRLDIRVVPLVMAAFFGHAFEHAEAYRKQLGEKLATGQISPERYQLEIKAVSPEHLENTLRQAFGDWSKDKDVKPYELTRTLEEARSKTFDKHGRRKESKLTPVYRMMLYNWITIENMSGPKELTHLLLRAMGDKDFFVAYDRVKQICSRLGVKFKGHVKEI